MYRVKQGGVEIGVSDISCYKVGVVGKGALLESVRTTSYDAVRAVTAPV
jgi:hypothetical protein